MSVEIEDIRRLVVHPGETLVIRVPKGTSEERAKNIREAVHANLPEGVQFVIATDDVDFEVVAGALAGS